MGQHETETAFMTVLAGLRMEGALSEAAFKELVTTKKDSNEALGLGLVSDARQNDHKHNPRSRVIS